MKIQRKYKQWAEDIVDASKATAEFVSKIPEKAKNLKDNAVEWIAERMSWNKTAQDKLFQAQEPTLNRLSKERNTQQIRNKSDVANELIVKRYWEELRIITNRYSSRE